jgi:hypothetical protein
VSVIIPGGIADGEDAWLSAREAAERAGIAERTWTGYVARHQAPQHGRRNPDTGKKEWTTAAVDEWLGSRPGPGARRDLEARA